MECFESDRFSSTISLYILEPFYSCDNNQEKVDFFKISANVVLASHNCNFEKCTF